MVKDANLNLQTDQEEKSGELKRKGIACRYCANYISCGWCTYYDDEASPGGICINYEGK